MFLTWQLLVLVIAMEVVMGLAIGFAATALFLRSRLTLGTAFVGAFLGAVGLLLGAFLSGWADAHSAFVNGRLVDLSPSGEDLWLRNRIVEHQLAICAAAAILLPLAFLLIRSRIVRRSVS